MRRYIFEPSNHVATGHRTLRMNGPDLILKFLNHMNGTAYAVPFKKNMNVKRFLRGCMHTEIYDLLPEVCGANALNYSTISRWSANFKGGRESIEDDPHSREPPISTESTNASIAATIIDKDQ